MNERLYSVPQVAEILGCGRTTVYTLLQSGELKAVKLGNLRRVHSRDLQEYMESLRGNG